MRMDTFGTIVVLTLALGILGKVWRWIRTPAPDVLEPNRHPTAAVKRPMGDAPTAEHRLSLEQGRSNTLGVVRRYKTLDEVAVVDRERQLESVHSVDPEAYRALQSYSNGSTDLTLSEYLYWERRANGAKRAAWDRMYRR